MKKFLKLFSTFLLCTFMITSCANPNNDLAYNGSIIEESLLQGEYTVIKDNTETKAPGMVIWTFKNSEITLPVLNSIVFLPYGNIVSKKENYPVVGKWEQKEEKLTVTLNDSLSSTEKNYELIKYKEQTEEEIEKAFGDSTWKDNGGNTIKIIDSTNNKIEINAKEITYKVEKGVLITSSNELSYRIIGVTIIDNNLTFGLSLSDKDQYVYTVLTKVTEDTTKPDPETKPNPKPENPDPEINPNPNPDTPDPEPQIPDTKPIIDISKYVGTWVSGDNEIVINGDKTGTFNKTISFTLEITNTKVIVKVNGIDDTEITNITDSSFDYLGVTFTKEVKPNIPKGLENIMSTYKWECIQDIVLDTPELLDMYIYMEPNLKLGDTVHIVLDMQITDVKNKKFDYLFYHEFYRGEEKISKIELGNEHCSYKIDNYNNVEVLYIVTPNINFYPFELMEYNHEQKMILFTNYEIYDQQYKFYKKN